MTPVNLLNPRGVLRSLVAAAAMTGSVVAAASRDSNTAAGWTAYVDATEQRRARELARPDRFLAMSFSPDGDADRRAVLSGAIVVRHIESTNAQGEAIEVPAAMVHHWRGAVFIPAAKLDALLATLHDGGSGQDGRQEDVLQSRVLERGPDRMRVYLKLQRRKLVTVVYNTEHAVTFHRYGALRGETRSVATKIAELADPGSASERELPAGQDRGFLWRLNAYWRYEQVAGGVIAECESVSLSRTVPAVVRYVVGPLIESTARESMERTLSVFRQRFQR